MKGATSVLLGVKGLKGFLEHQERMRIEERQRYEATVGALVQAINGQNNQPQNETDSNSTNVNSIVGKNKLPHPSRPPILDVDITYSKFLAWKSTWNDYVMLQKLKDFPLEVQKADFRSCLSEEMKTHIKCVIDVHETSQESVDEILDKIQQFLRQKRNVTLDRVAFEEIKQHHGETFDSFYVAVKKQAEEADLCDHCIETRICTKIMVGIKSHELRQELLTITPFPDLKTVVGICRSHEAAVKNSEALEGNIPIGRISAYKKSGGKNGPQQKTNDKKQCHRCGKQPHSFAQCPAAKSECNKCHKMGHWGQYCKTKKNNGQKSDLNKYQQASTIEISDVTNNKNKTPRIKVSVSTMDSSGNQCNLQAVPDTGAEANIGGTNILQKLNIKKNELQPVYEKIIAANKTEISALGKTKVHIQYGNVSTNEEIIICPDRKELLLSWKTCQNLHIINEKFPEQIDVNLTSTKEFAECDITKKK